MGKIQTDLDRLSELRKQSDFLNKQIDSSIPVRLRGLRADLDS